MSSVKESRLLRFLADELAHLELLESYTLGAGPDPTYPLVDQCKVTWLAQWAPNGKDASTAMQDAISTLVTEGMPELIQTAVARQRVAVQAARDALHAYQTRVQDTPLDEKVLDGDEAAGFAPAPAAAVEAVHAAGDEF